MCLAVPMRIKTFLDDGRAIAAQEGLETEVDLTLVENARIGDYVIVHAGYAIEILDLDEATERLELFRAMEELQEPER